MRFSAILAVLLITNEARADANLERIVTLMEASQNAMSFLSNRQIELLQKLNGIETTFKGKIDGLAAKQDHLFPRIEHMEAQQDTFIPNITTMETKLNTLLAKVGQMEIKQDTFVTTIEQIGTKQDNFLPTILQMITKLFGQLVDNQITEIDEKIISVNSTAQQILLHLNNKTGIINANVVSINSKLEKLSNSNVEIELNLQLSNTSIIERLKEINNRTLILQQTLNASAVNKLNKTAEIAVTNESFTTQDFLPRRNYTTGGCGEIMITEKGAIKFEQDFVGDFICVWTVRVNKKVSAAFQLKLLKGNAIVTLTPGHSYHDHEYSEESGFTTPSYDDEFLEDGFPSSQQIFRTPGQTEFIVVGPTVFVTLSGKNENGGGGGGGPIKMELYFEGRGGNSSLTSFYHYQPSTSKGDVSYPKDRGSGNYTANEFASFVINPRRLDANMYMGLTKLNLEVSEGCTMDSVSFYRYDTDSTRYERVGPSAIKYWYCEPLASLPTTVGFAATPWIIVFKSDGSVQNEGFGFNWYTQ